MKQQVIPIHRMDTEALLGIDFSYLDIGDKNDEALIKSYKNTVHRDTHYLFLFMNTAEALLTVDFEEMLLTGNNVLYVRPGQIHFVSSIRGPKGWALAIDPMLVEKDYKNTFEGQFHTQRPIPLDTSASTRMEDAARLLHTAMQAKPTTFSPGIISNLANVFIGMIAEQYADLQENKPHHQSRPTQIAHQFRELLAENYKTLKSPIQYAKILNYSLSHLNESVKNITGFPVSYWIHQQVVLEAKRLLYYTSMDVREIAFSLGYEDHTYFSRLFSKVVGVSPGTFRRKYHE